MYIPFKVTKGHAKRSFIIIFQFRLLFRCVMWQRNHIYLYQN